MAATVALALGGMASTAFAAGVDKATVTIDSTVTSNTCNFASATPAAITVAGASIAQITANTAPLEMASVTLSNCTATDAEPAVQFNATAAQLSSNVWELKDNKLTGAALRLFKDPYGQDPINPVTGDTNKVSFTGTTAVVPFYVQLAQPGATAPVAGPFEAQSDVKVDYP